MADREALTDNHSREPVPDSETVGGVRIATVLIGVFITLPAFLIGAEVLAGLGAVKGLTAIGGAAAILVCAMALTMHVGARTRLSTYNLIGRAFGETGALIVNGVLTLTLIGWYGVTAMLFGRACAAALGGWLGVAFPEELFAALGSVLMITTTVFGFRAIGRLSRVAVPLLLALLIAGAYRTVSQTTWDTLLQAPPDGTDIRSVGHALSILIGASMVGVAIVPDLARFAKDTAASLRAAVLSHGLGYPLVLGLAGLPALVTGSQDLIGNMIAIGLGLPALLVVVFATWTTNANNLYSASLVLAKIWPRARDWVITLTAGVLGTGLALAGILEHFIGFLELLSVTIPPIAGIYVVDYFSGRLAGREAGVRPPVNWVAFVAWAAGTTVSAKAADWGLALTMVPACDAMLVAAMAYAGGMTALRRVGKPRAG